MKIVLGKAVIWGHDEIKSKTGELFTLTKSNPGPVEVDFDSLTPVLQTILTNAIQAKSILDYESKTFNLADMAQSAERQLDALFSMRITEFTTALNQLVIKKKATSIEQLLIREKAERKDKKRLALLQGALTKIGDVHALDRLYFTCITKEDDKVISKEELEKLIESQRKTDDQIKVIESIEPKKGNADNGKPRRRKSNKDIPSSGSSRGI